MQHSSEAKTNGEAEGPAVLGSWEPTGWPPFMQDCLTPAALAGESDLPTVSQLALQRTVRNAGRLL